MMQLIFAQIINNIFRVYTGIILVYCIMSWIPSVHGSGFISDLYRILGRVVNPFLNIFKKVIKPIGGSIDISPIIAIIVLQILVNLIVRLISMI